MDDGSTAVVDQEPFPLPKSIDGFTIEALLGHGASGAVYQAQQHRPERRVALKVLTRGVLNLRSRERFEREVELLAGIEHPNIPRLYGTGSWDTESLSYPYLVMERVDGKTLVSHCVSNHLPPRERIALLAVVARAVHHVHTRGVMHRDLKPQNILVTPRGVPMVLDFGVAKWRDASGDDATLTRSGEVVGTLPYMSPEQIEGLSEAIDLRSDIYALGVIGFELVAGRLPYPDNAFRTVVTALETLRHDPPERQPGRLDIAVDLRTVLAKAVSADRRERYQSALEFALDLERYLDNLPVQAQRPTLAHVLRLFVRRHRAASLAAGVALAGLTAGLVASIHFGLREQAALAQADARAAELDSTNSFLADMLQAADPMHTGGNKVSMRTVIDQARNRLLVEQHLRPAVDIRVRMLLGATYVGLGDQDTGLALDEEALRRARNNPEIDADLRILTTVNLANALARTPDAKRAIALLEPLRSLPAGTREENRRRWLHIRSSLEQAALTLSAIDDAERYDREIGDQADRWFGRMDADALQVRSDRITIADFRDRHEQVLRDATALADEIGSQLSPRHPLRAAMLETAGANAYHMERLDLAQRLLGEAARVNLDLYGPDALNTLDSQQRVAQVAHRLKPAEQAPIDELKRIMETEFRLFGENDLFATASLNFYARALLDRHEAKAQVEAERLLGRVVDQVHAGTRPVTVSTLNVEARLARLMLDSGRSERGIQLFREVKAAATRSFGAQSDLVVTADAALASVGASASRAAQP